MFVKFSLKSQATATSVGTLVFSLNNTLATNDFILMKEKYTKITIKILICIPIFFSLFIIDQLILPQKQVNDKIVSYSQIVISRRNKYSSYSTKEFVGNKFYTEKGYEFSIRKTFIEENEVIIGRSYIFQNINSIKTKSKDYSDKLMSGLNGACFYFALSLTITAIISLIMLKFKTNLSENGFQNIILINSFLTLIVIYLYSIYN